MAIKYEAIEQKYFNNLQQLARKQGRSLRDQDTIEATLVALFANRGIDYLTQSTQSEDISLLWDGQHGVIKFGDDLRTTEIRNSWGVIMFDIVREQIKDGESNAIYGHHSKGLIAPPSPGFTRLALPEDTSRYIYIKQPRTVITTPALSLV